MISGGSGLTDAPTFYDSIKLARVREWELTGVLNFGVGLTDVPKCSTTILSQTSWRGNLLKPIGSHGRYGHRTYEWLLIALISGGFRLTDAPTAPPHLG